MSSPSVQRVERFYRGLIGRRAEQLHLLVDAAPVKVARAVRGRFDQSQLVTLVGELDLTVDRTSGRFMTRPLHDDAVLIDAALAGKLSEHVAFNEGRIYLQSVPSYLVVRHLPLEAADYVLDLCASPGGKALHCYDRLARVRPVLVNEYSRARRLRLINVLRTYHAEHLPLLGIDAGTVCRYVVNALPVIILDAPCSGEGHLLRNKKQLSQWRPGQTKRLALRQRAMAGAAVHALKVGGILLYSTCTISPYENELMVGDLLKKFGPAIEVIPWPAEALSNLPESADQIGVLDRVQDVPVDRRIVQSAWRFWPAAFGEPFFAALIRKVQPTEPKRPVRPVPIRYPRRRSGQAPRVVEVGPRGREYLVPAHWPDLPPLPYLRIG